MQKTLDFRFRLAADQLISNQRKAVHALHGYCMVGRQFVKPIFHSLLTS
jgi:hypothetical protein